jgi:hypothetical protein
MNLHREPKVVITGPRAMFAAIAVLAATAIVASVVALAGHYDEEFLRMARAQAALTAAQRPASQDGSTTHAIVSLSHEQAKPDSHA